MFIICLIEPWPSGHVKTNPEDYVASAKTCDLFHPGLLFCLSVMDFFTPVAVMEQILNNPGFLFKTLRRLVWVRRLDFNDDKVGLIDFREKGRFFLLPRSTQKHTMDKAIRPGKIIMQQCWINMNQCCKKIWPDKGTNYKLTSKKMLLASLQKEYWYFVAIQRMFKF